MCVCVCDITHDLYSLLIGVSIFVSEVDRLVALSFIIARNRVSRTLLSFLLSFSLRHHCELSDKLSVLCEIIELGSGSEVEILGFNLEQEQFFKINSKAMCIKLNIITFLITIAGFVMYSSAGKFV